MLVSLGKAVFQSSTRGSGRQICRCLSTSTPTRSGAYDSDGKTTVDILNKQPGLGLMIDAYSKSGFRLNNGSFVFGPIAIFPKTVFSWKVRGDEDIHEDSLDLFTVLEPRPDIVIVGFGRRPEFKRQLDKLLHRLRVTKKMNLEVLPTDQAVSTFNFLIADGRYVVAALIPPEFIKLTYDDAIVARDKKKKLYEENDSG